MKKCFIFLLLLFSFISCNDADNQEGETPSKSPTNKSTIIKISNMSNDTVSEIYTNYEEAFKIAKEKDLAVFILFSTQYCRWCSKLKETTLKNREVIQRLNQEFVVLFLDRDLDEYPSKYTVKGVPVVYMTDKNEEIFTAIIGYHKNPKDYMKWFNYIQVELGR